MNCDYQKVSTIILAYPSNFKNEFSKCTSIVDDLINQLPHDINIQIVTTNEDSINQINQLHPDRIFETIKLEKWDDIWMRDCLGFINGNQFVKPIYFPKYCDYKNRWDYFKRINKASRKIINHFLSKPIVDLPLIWDGGNLVNNKQFGFITTKIIEDNPSFNQLYIERMIEERLEIKPIIIPRQKGDVIGHVDGYMSFIDHKKIALSSYPDMAFLKKDNEYLEQLRSIVLSYGLDLTRTKDRPIDEAIACNCNKFRRKGCFYTAKGNYVNNLRINNTVIMPEYTLSTKRETNYYNQSNKDIYQSMGFNVRTVNCDALAQFGGSLHCLSFTY
ncbi:agmatine deiminase family protein [Pedobacter hartonius]|uniref:Agmatine/peptidylarginine deiminase n=1 Tax=Pedobacter hartonius TaxID=425514 RepID=A0A1H4F6M4_9SPHI|nr:agmatine deiminase family protein [Pedobacter hartonius]SEA92570.1 Agmatine/peptidylarginine deiminase [Pedobacter hartonius]